MTPVRLYGRVADRKHPRLQGTVQKLQGLRRAVVAWDSGITTSIGTDRLLGLSLPEPPLPVCAGCGCRLISLDDDRTAAADVRWADDNRFDGPHNTAQDCPGNGEGHSPLPVKAGVAVR